MLSRAAILLAATVLAPSLASADGSVDITLSPRGQELADALQIDTAALESQLAAQISTAFDLLNPGDYLTAFADAAAFSNRGIGVDYASGKSRFEVGFSANLSASLGDKGIDEIEADRPVAGFAPNLTFMAGWNLERMGVPQLTLYANGFHRSATDKENELTASITSAGVHGQWRFFRLKRSFRASQLLMLWGGVDVTAGFEFSRWSFEKKNELETELPLGGDSGALDVLLVSDGSYGVSSTALTVPVEVSTSVRFMGLLWLFGGAGIDLQLGSADVSADLNGTMTNAQPINGETFEVGTARILLEESAGPSVGRLRFLGGVQLDIWHFKTFVQANLMPDQAASVAFGVRGDI